MNLTNDIEHSLLKQARILLDEPEFELTDNLFESGGDSVVAAQILLTAVIKWDVQISIVDFYRQPTVRFVAEKVLASINESCMPADGKT